MDMFDEKNFKEANLAANQTDLSGRAAAAADCGIL
jgi:hypothetical protein